MDYEVLETKALVLASMIFFYYGVNGHPIHSRTPYYYYYIMSLFLFPISFLLANSTVPLLNSSSYGLVSLLQVSWQSCSHMLSLLLYFPFNLYPKTGFHHHHSFTRSPTISIVIKWTSFCHLNFSTTSDMIPPSFPNKLPYFGIHYATVVFYPHVSSPVSLVLNMTFTEKRLNQHNIQMHCLRILFECQFEQTNC